LYLWGSTTYVLALLRLFRFALPRSYTILYVNSVFRLGQFPSTVVWYMSEHSQQLKMPDFILQEKIADEK
jgi:hypothetical protein